MEHPSRLLDWLQTFLLGLCLTVTLWGVGGNLAYGKSLPVSGLLIVLLSIVHAFFWIFRRDKLHFNRYSLLPLPFLIIALVQAYLSPVPWFGMLTFATWLQAYLIFFISLHSFRTQGDVFHLLGVMVFLHVLALSGAFFEMYFYPMWHPGVEISRVTDVADYAAGFFHSPERLGASLLLLLPFLIIGCALRRFPGPIRIFLGFIAFATLVGIFLTVSRPAILSIFLLLALLPLFLEERWRKRRKIYLYELGALIVMFPFIWFLTTTMRSSLEQIFSGDFTLLNENSTRMLSMAIKEPVLGFGLGSYDTTADLAGAQVRDVLESELVSGYASMFIELGAVGLLFLLIPLFFLLYRGFVEWKNLPFSKLTAEEESRVRKAGGSRSRRKKRKEVGRAPSGKIILGGIVLGWILFLLVQLGENISGSAFIVYYAAIGLSVLIYQLPNQTVSIRDKRGFVLLGACLPVLLAGVGYRLSAPLAIAQYYTLVGDRELDEIEDKGGLLFRQPSRLFDVENDFKIALNLSPKHGTALEGLGRSQLARLDTGLYTEQQVGQLALGTLDRALQVYEKSWRVNYDLARAMDLAGTDPEVFSKYVEQAISYGPSHAEPLVLKAGLILDAKEGQKEARELIEKALSLDPNNPEAIRLINQMNLNQK